MAKRITIECVNCDQTSAVTTLANIAVLYCPLCGDEVPTDDTDDDDDDEDDFWSDRPDEDDD